MKYSDTTTSFFHDVYEVVKLIPEGRVTSYGAIASFLGSGGSSRMVGWAMNACHSHTDYIPAHRVVNRNGLLTGRLHFETPETMQLLLEREGIVINNNAVVNFERLFWDPACELL
jgi:methylated-DNA-protein-cysteine methyltransferase-like protein